MRVRRYGAGLGVAILMSAVSMPAWSFDIESDLLKQEGDDPLAWVEDYKSHMDDRLTLSGSIRNRFESRDEFDFNNNTVGGHLDDTWGLLRFRLRADLEAHENLKLVGELQSSHTYEYTNSNAASARVGAGASQDRLDVFQAYADVKNLADIPELTVRVGRYTLAYGKQRLVGAFAWSNVARSFQGVRAAWEEDDWWLHVFYNDVVVPVDDHANEGATANNLSGVYMQYHGYDWGKTEAYVLRHEQDHMGGARVNGLETYTVGARFEAKWPGNEAIDLDGEFAYQDGKASTALDHQAFALHVGGGYTFQDVAWTPRAGGQYNYATGDTDATDGKNETFDNLFPTNHLHYGYMDRFSWRNMHNVQFELSAKPYKTLQLKFDYHMFWLDEASSAPWQHAGGGVIRGGTVGADNSVGQEIDLTVKWKYYKHLVVAAGYSHFFTDDFVTDSSLGVADDDADWWFLQTVFKF